MSYLRIKTVVHSAEDIDFSDLSSTPSLPAYYSAGGSPVLIKSNEFTATSAAALLFPDVTSALNVRDCVIQNTGSTEIVILFNGVSVLVVPRNGTTPFIPVYGAANQLLYTLTTNGQVSGLVRVISVTLDGYGAA